MFLEIINFLILVVIIASHIRLTRRIRSHELLVMNEKTEIMLMVHKTHAVASKILDTAQRVGDHQNSLDDKMNALAILVDQHSTNVIFQMNMFNELARTDVLSARREELFRTKELHVALERLMGVASASRQPPAPNDVLALENLTKRIGELESIIERGDV